MFLLSWMLLYPNPLQPQKSVSQQPLFSHLPTEAVNLPVFNEAASGPSFTEVFPQLPVAIVQTESVSSMPVLMPSTTSSLSVDMPVSTVSAPTVSSQERAPEAPPPSGQWWCPVRVESQLPPQTTWIWSYSSLIVPNVILFTVLLKGIVDTEINIHSKISCMI